MLMHGFCNIDASKLLRCALVYHQRRSTATNSTRCAKVSLAFHLTCAFAIH
eukprot:m.1015 g.1015  ORF g.1015 m.1015 type:complete len:51 (+) comp1013_c0_seq1:117-269(+)